MINVIGIFTTSVISLINFAGIPSRPVLLEEFNVFYSLRTNVSDTCFSEKQTLLDFFFVVKVSKID